MTTRLPIWIGAMIALTAAASAHHDPNGIRAWGLHDPGLDSAYELRWGESPASVRELKPEACASFCPPTRDTTAPRVSIHLVDLPPVRDTLAALADLTDAQRTAALACLIECYAPDAMLERSRPAAKRVARARARADEARASVMLNAALLHERARASDALAIGARFQEVIEELVAGIEMARAFEYALADHTPPPIEPAPTPHAPETLGASESAGAFVAWLDAFGAECWDDAERRESIAAE